MRTTEAVTAALERSLGIKMPTGFYRDLQLRFRHLTSSTKHMNATEQAKEELQSNTCPLPVCDTTAKYMP